METMTVFEKLAIRQKTTEVFSICLHVVMSYLSHLTTLGFFAVLGIFKSIARCESL